MTRRHGPHERPLCDPCAALRDRELDAGVRPTMTRTPPMIQIGGRPTPESVARENRDRSNYHIGLWRGRIEAIERACQRGPALVGCAHRPEPVIECEDAA